MQVASNGIPLRLAAMKLIRRFREHPAAVGESYPEHCVHAASFGWAMLCGALACFVHAVFPWVCTNTGSKAIIRLHDRMVVNRLRFSSDEMSAPNPLDSFAAYI
jgi:hypothetical protein